MNSLRTTSQKVFERLLDTLGPQHWWPGDSPLEVMVGAILVQNTNWKNVELAIKNLKATRALDIERLLSLEGHELEGLIRPAGYFRRKAKSLRSLMEFIRENYQCSIPRLKAVEQWELREQLLAVHGVGPETADAVLLYALEKPVMVVDAYTQRIYARHGWIDYEADYHQLQELMTNEIAENVQTYNELHALLVEAGKRYCRKTPQCEECPLVDMLPKSGVCNT